MNATAFIETFQASDPLKSPVVNFVIYIDNTYFQTPQALLIYLIKGGSFPSFLLLDNEEESDVVVFSADDELPPQIQYTRSVIYVNPAEAGEYDFDLVVSVLVREELSGLVDLRETRISTIHVTVEGMDIN